MSQAAADEGQCTCGMELGKKLSMIEHLITTNPTLVGEGKSIDIDLRSSSPWSMQHTYIEFKSTYGAEDKRGVRVRLDAGAARFTLESEGAESKEGPMRELQATLEQRHLAHMLEDAERQYAAQSNLDAAWLKEALSAMRKAADAQKPLDPALREGWRMFPRSAALRDVAPGLYDLLVRVDSSVERWFVPYSGLTASEIDERLSQAQEAERRGEIEGALRELEDIVELAPSHGGAQHALGALLVSHYPETRLGQARRALERAVQLVPTKAAAHQHLGDVHFIGGDLALAKRAYQHAVELGREALCGSLFGLGQIAELEQDWQAAKTYYVRAARAEADPAARRIIDFSAVRIERKQAMKGRS